MTAEEQYRLPLPAVATIADPDLQFHLHSIPFSHYNERARWFLRLAGIPYTRHDVLPLVHMWSVPALHHRFPAAQCAKGKRSRQAETPALAVYTAAGKPVCLIQDGALIGRYCVLRAQALGHPCPPLYGGALTLRDDGVVLGGGEDYEQIEALEARFSGRLGVEGRRVVYSYILPQSGLLIPLLRNNASSCWQALLAPLLYLVMRWGLPRMLKVNAKTAAEGRQKLRAEFAYASEVLAANAARAGTAAQQQQQGQEGQQRGRQQFLVGGRLTAADVALATVGSVVLLVGHEQGYGAWMPPLAALPPAARLFIQELRETAAGKHVFRLFEQFARPQLAAKF